MGLKPLLFTCVALILFLGYFIVGSDKVSDFIETYAKEKLKEPDIEKAARFNINYLNFTAKYEKALELIEKYIQKYPENAQNNRLDRIYYIKAKTMDQMINNAAARDAYKQYLELYPEGKYAEDVKMRLREMLVY